MEFYGPTPFKHQIEAFEFIKDRHSSALLMEMGTGKSRVAIDFIRYESYKVKRVMRTLIICPKIAMWNWYNEINKFSRLSETTVVLTGSKIDKLMKLSDRRYDVFIINFDSLFSIVKELTKCELSIMIIDESQRIKNMKAKRTKSAVMLSKCIPKCLLLSGSPMLNSPADIFSQWLVMDKGKTFGTNFFSFRNNYMEDANAGWKAKGQYYPNWQPKLNMLSELQEKIMRSAFIKKKIDCLDLPDKVYHTVELELDGEQKRLYTEMKKEMITYFQDNPVVASIALTKMMRLSQITSGFVKVDMGEEIVLPDNPKITALQELIDDLPDNTKIIIWAWFKSNSSELARYLAAYQPVVLDGSATIEQRKEREYKFNTDPTCRICIANQAAAGLSINLVSASYVIYFSQTFSLEHRVQSEDRCHRIGSEIHDKITYIDLVFKDTIDEVMSDRLQKKKELSDYVISDIIKEVLE